MDKFEFLILQHVKKFVQADNLTPAHEKYVIRLYRNMNPAVFKGKTASTVLSVLGKVLGLQLQKQMQNELAKTIDAREYQIAMLGTADGPDNAGDSSGLIAPTLEKNIEINKFLGIDDITELKLAFNPESLYTHYYLVLDSNYRDTTDEDPTAIKKFTWKYAPTQDTGTGFANSVGVIRNIIGMRMYQPRIPYLAEMDTDAKRVSVLIEEFASQAFIGENNRRFHFLLRPNFVIGQTSIELSTEDYNDGIFNFRDPITTVSSFTLSFGQPLDILTFAAGFDRFIVCFEFVCLNL